MGRIHPGGDCGSGLQVLPLTLPLLGVPESLQPKAGLFLHAIGFGMPAVTMYAALRGYSEAIGYPRPVTAISLMALLLLVPLNFILCMELAYSGTGQCRLWFATAILQWLMLMSLALYILKIGSIKAVSHLVIGKS